MLGYILLYGLVLLVVSYVGHVLWLLLTGVVRAILGKACPQCGSILTRQGTCPRCKHPAVEAIPTLAKDLLAAQRLIQFAQAKRVLGAEQLQHFRSFIQALQRAELEQSVLQGPIPSSEHSRAAPQEGQPRGSQPRESVPPILGGSPIHESKGSQSRPEADRKVVGPPLPSSSVGLPHAPPVLTDTSSRAGDLVYGIGVGTRPPDGPADPAVSVQQGGVGSIGTTISERAVALTGRTESYSGQVGRAEPNRLAPREVHPLDALEEDVDRQAAQRKSAPSLPQVQNAARQWTADMITSFMERSNIRWIELTAATMIVVCSVGLVISLWNTLSSTNRFFPSIVFMLATLAVHGAGQYTLKRWRLKSTSRGILNVALMLIPLSVMIGILLSRRQGEMLLDWQFYGVLTIATIVYGGLAVTAARSLFSIAWFPAAASNIVGCLSLLAIAIAAKRGVSMLESAGLMVPVAATTMAFAWELSWSAGVRQQRTLTFFRRQIGMVVQILFVTLAVFVFWRMQLGSISGLRLEWSAGFDPSRMTETNTWAWLVIGVWAGAWGCWGAICAPMFLSFRSSGGGASGIFGVVESKPIRNDCPRGARTIKLGVEISSLLVFAWFIGFAATGLLFVASWQLSLDRVPLVLLLGIVGAWLWSLGYLTRLTVAIRLGGFLNLVALSIGLELWISGNTVMAWSDWVSFERVGSLSGLGVLMVGVTRGILVYRAVGVRPEPSSRPWSLFPSWRMRWRARGTMDRLATGLGEAAWLAIGLGVVMTLLAICVADGRTPHGGDWAPLLLGIHGILIVGAGVVWFPDRPWVRWTGQGLGMLAAFRICSEATWLPEGIAQWRPWLVLSIGGSVLSGLWSVVSLLVFAVDRRGLRLRGLAIQHGVDRSALGFSESTVALAMASAVGLWFTSEPLQLVLPWGWILPVVFALQSFVSREAAFGRGVWMSAMVWCLAIVFQTGQSTGFWQAIGPMASVSAWVAIACVLWIPNQLGFESQRDFWISAKPESSIESSAAALWYDVLLSVLTLSVVGTTVGMLGISIEAVRLGDLPWWLLSAQPAQQRWYFGLTVAAIGVWTLTMQLRRDPRATSPQHALLGGAIWLTVLLVGTHAMPGSAWHATAWSLSGLTAFSATWSGWYPKRAVRFGDTEDGLGVGSTWVWRNESAGPAWLATWIQFGSGSLMLMALPLLGLHGLGQTQLGASATVVPNWFADGWGGAESSTRLAALALWFGPLVCVATAQWVIAIQRGRDVQWSLCTSVWMAAWVSVLLIMMRAAPHAELISRLLVWLESFAIGFGAIGLGTSVLASGAARLSWLAWRQRTQVEHPDGERQCKDAGMRAAGWISWIALAPIVGVSFVSVWRNIECGLYFPIAASNGALATGTALVLTSLALLVSVQARRWDRSVVAMVLIGLVAPVAAHHSMAFLTRGWGQALAPQYGYRAEPLHAMLLLWLVALAVGLSQRSLGAMASRRWSWEVGVWFLYAWMVGFLGIWQPRGVSVGWMLAIESGLALLLVVRGLRTSTPLLGHGAAVLGATALCLAQWPWLIRETWLRGSVVLWAPVLCGWLSLGWQWMNQRRGVGELLKTSELTGAEAVGGTSVGMFEGGWNRPSWVTVDQSVSLHVPLAMIVWSFLAVGAGEDVRGRLQTHWIENLGLSIGALGLAVARMWDSRSGSRGWGVYVNGLSVALTTAAVLPNLTSERWDERFLVWVLSGLGAMATMALCLREWVRESGRLIPALRLGMLAPRQTEFVRSSVWMARFHTLAGLLLVGPCVLLVLGEHPAFTQRLAALIPFLSVLTILPLANQLHYRLPRISSVMLVSVAAVLIGWSALAQFAAGQSSASWEGASGGGAWWELHFQWAHWQRAFVIVVVLLWVYRWSAERLRHQLDWGTILHAASRVCVIAAFACGVVSLFGIAVSMRGAPGTGQNDAGSGWETFGAWVALGACMFQFALRPSGLDSGASRVARQGALYASEVAWIAGVCGLRLQYPWIFDGIIAEWWPILFYLFAMMSIGLEQWYRRNGDGVFNHPLVVHSVLLPLVPLVGAWTPWTSEVTSAWREPLAYSTMLLASAVAYGVLGNRRGAPWLKLASIGLVLASYWVALSSQSGLRFWAHPQVWIIPPAIAVLIFIERNRDRLAPTVISGTRYMAVLFIYASSTLEMVLHAFELQFWTPIVLLALAVTGVMVGIGLRVRAFLYCGGAFVMIALIGMVWHAQQAIQQVWPWWVFGIAMGIALIVLIGTFEKNRDRLLATIESLRKWQP